MLRSLQSRLRPKWPLFIVVTLFVTLCVAYNFALPLFEGDDEGDHFRYVNYIADHLSLPDLNQTAEISHEIVQPPLYYAISSLFVAWINRSDLSDVMRPYKVGNIYFFDHTDAETVFPPRGTVLAVRLNRLLSSALGAASIVLIYQLTLLLFDHTEVALLAAGLTAFNPKFVQMSSVVSNDIAVAFAGALTLFCLTRVLRRPEHGGKRAFVALGACIGLAFLCKTNGLALFIPAFAGVAYLAYREEGEERQPLKRAMHNTARRAYRYMGLCLAGFLLVAGWYLVYCQVLYGNPLAWSQVQLANEALRRITPLNLVEMAGTIPEIVATYWNILRYGIHWALVIDIIFDLLDAIALVGVCIRLAHRRSQAALALLSVDVFASLITFLPWLRDYQMTENARLLAPAFAALPVLLAVGLLAWFPETLWRLVSRVLIVAAAAGAIAAIWLVLVPTYDAPHYLTAAEERALPSTGHVQFNNGIELLYASLSTNRISPGNEVTLTVYWHATRFVERPYLVSLQTYSQDGVSIDRRVIQPLGGRLNTAQWGRGVLRDEYHLHYPPVDKQMVAQVYIGWIEYDPPYRVAHLAGSSAVSAQIAEIKLRGARPADVKPPRTFSTTFGGIIRLEGYDLHGDTLQLYWRGMAAPDRNYTVFVHAMNVQGGLVGQSDQPMHYPTSLWDPGEQVIDVHTVPDLSEAASIQIGLYDPTTGVRLHAVRLDGTAWPNDSAVIECNVACGGQPDLSEQDQSVLMR